jgi:hypothetical protein
MAGSTGSCTIVADWLAQGAPYDNRPEFDDYEPYGIAIRRNVVYHIEGRLPTLIPTEGKFTAAGSGRDFAIAAMSLGHSAEEAVQIACNHDVYSGLGINVVRTSPSRQRGRKRK